MQKAGISDGCQAFDETLGVFGDGCWDNRKDRRGNRELPLELSGQTWRERAPTVLEQRQVRLRHTEPRGRVLLRPAFPLALLSKPSSVDLAQSKKILQTIVILKCVRPGIWRTSAAIRPLNRR